MGISLNGVSVICPHCKKKIWESGNMWMYGSPIRTCKECNKEYYNPRWREVALQGLDPRSENSRFYGLGALGLAGVSLLITLFIYFMEVYTNSYSYAMDAVDIMCVLGCIVCIFLFIRQKLGFEDRANKKYMEESKMRLRNPEYVEKLRSYGVIVPEDLINSL